MAQGSRKHAVRAVVFRSLSLSGQEELSYLGEGRLLHGPCKCSGLRVHGSELNSGYCVKPSAQHASCNHTTFPHSQAMCSLATKQPLKSLQSQQPVLMALGESRGVQRLRLSHARLIRLHHLCGMLGKQHLALPASMVLLQTLPLARPTVVSRM
jgi:hypothetical protein